jgi:K+/H+ antiporter YhaU regulatory subunit KhtT
MDITHAIVPGIGIVHHCSTRGGQRFGVVVDDANRRSLLTYDPADPADPADPDVPRHSIVLEQEEADQLAEMLHSRTIPDRLAALERRLAELAGKAP